MLERKRKNSVIWLCLRGFRAGLGDSTVSGTVRQGFIAGLTGGEDEPQVGQQTQVALDSDRTNSSFKTKTQVGGRTRLRKEEEQDSGRRKNKTQEGVRPRLR